MRASTVAVAALFVLAGCSGGVGLSGESTPPSTVTPAPVPTLAPADRTLAPGLTGAGLADTEALTASHRSRLETGSYTQRTDSVVLVNGTAVAGRHLSVERAGDRYRLGFALTGERRRESRSYQTVAATVWANESLSAQRVTNRANTTEYETVTAGFYREFVRPNVRLYTQLLAENDARVVDRETRNGTRFYHLRATVERVPAAFGVRGVGATGPGTVRVTVSERGVLHRVEITQPVLYGGGEGTLRHTLSYTGMGETTVGRPPWLDRAVREGRSTPTPYQGVGPSTNVTEDPNREPPA